MKRKTLTTQSSRTGLALLFALLIGGCGGGGGNDDNSPTPPPAAPSEKPKGFPDTVQVEAGSSITGQLNTTGLNASSLEFMISNPPEKGTLTLTNANKGLYLYQSNSNSNSTDSFKFVASDGKLSTTEATISININPPDVPDVPDNNKAPIAIASCSTTSQEKTLEGTLKASDEDNSNNELTFSLDPNTPMFTGPITTALGATVELLDATTGEYLYTAADTAGGNRGMDTFTFRVDDPKSFSTETETVIVHSKIMWLGDSITKGTVDGSGSSSLPSPAFKVGARKPAFDRLLDLGYNSPNLGNEVPVFDFVGGESFGYHSSLGPFDSDNEGHGGWSAGEIAWGREQDGSDGVYTFLNKSPTGIIMLHIGTNKFNTNPDDVESILNEIDRWENDNSTTITVVLARIIGRKDSVPNTEVNQFNDNVVNMALARDEDNIIIVDQFSALTYPNDIKDKLHPTVAAYTKMAEVWLYPLAGEGNSQGSINANTPLLPKCT